MKIYTSADQSRCSAWFKRLTRVNKAESEGGFEDSTSDVVLLRLNVEQDNKSAWAWAVA